MRGKLVAKVCVQLHVLCAVQWNNCILLPFCLRLGRLKGLGLQEASWIFEAASVPSPIALSRCSARGIVPFWGEVYDAQLESRVRVLRTVFFKLLEPSPFLYYVAFAHSCLCQQFKFICKLRMFVLWLGLFFPSLPSECCTRSGWWREHCVFIVCVFYFCAQRLNWESLAPPRDWFYKFCEVGYKSSLWRSSACWCYRNARKEQQW